MLTKLKTYKKMHVPFGDHKNGAYEVTRATAYCSDCKRRVQLKYESRGQWAETEYFWAHAILGCGPRYEVKHRAEIAQETAK